MEPGCLKHFTGPARSGSWMQSNSVSRLRPRDGNGIQLDQHGHLGLAVMEIWTCKVSTSSDSWFAFRYGSFHRCSYGGLGSLLGQLRSRNNAELCNWMPTTKTVPQREWTLTYATMPYQLKFSSTTWEIQNCIGGHVTRSILIYIYVLGKEFSNLCDPTILTSCYICCTCINLLTIQGVRMTQAISPKIKRMHWIWPQLGMWSDDFRAFQIRPVANCRRICSSFFIYLHHHSLSISPFCGSVRGRWFQGAFCRLEKGTQDFFCLFGVLC